MNNYAIAFDVGGLFIKSAVLNAEGVFIPDSYAIFPSKAKESIDEITEHLVYMIKQQTNRILDKHFQITGVGYAFPGPFDYVNGISYISGIDKFEALYGANLRHLLIDRLKQEPSFYSKVSNQFRIVFDNDANLFALGEYAAGKAKSYNKLIFLTIGTGAGSAFMEDGELIKDRQDVPQNGWIFKHTFKQSIVDDYISKRGILQLAKELNLTIPEDEVKGLAHMAINNNLQAQALFHKFGNNVGEALNPHINNFQPDALVFGGQITKSKDLFLNGIYETLEKKAINIEFTEETSLSTFVGVANLLNQSVNHDDQ